MEKIVYNITIKEFFLKESFEFLNTYDPKLKLAQDRLKTRLKISGIL